MHLIFLDSYVVRSGTHDVRMCKAENGHCLTGWWNMGTGWLGCRQESSEVEHQ
jgi:hypothetical protein